MPSSLVPVELARTSLKVLSCPYVMNDLPTEQALGEEVVGVLCIRVTEVAYLASLHSPR
jgi:hypothetical protein